MGSILVEREIHLEEYAKPASELTRVPSVFENNLQGVLLDPTIEVRNVGGTKWQIQKGFQPQNATVGSMRISGGIVLPVEGTVVGRTVQMQKREDNSNDYDVKVTHYVLNDPNNIRLWAHPGKIIDGLNDKKEKIITETISIGEAQALLFSQIISHSEIPLYSEHVLVRFPQNQEQIAA